MLIKETNLSIRSKNALESEGLITVQSLVDEYKSGIDFGEIRNLGSKSISEIIAFCKSFESFDQIEDETEVRLINRLRLNPVLHHSLMTQGIHTIEDIRNISDSQIANLAGLTFNDRKELKIIRKTLRVAWRPSAINIERSSSSNLESDAKNINVYQNLLCVIDQKRSFENLSIEAKKNYMAFQKGSISGFEMTFRSVRRYLQMRFGENFGYDSDKTNSAKLKSNNQLFSIFLEKKLKNAVSTIECSKEEIIVTLQSNEDEIDGWIIQKMLSVYKLAFLKIGDLYYVIDRKSYSDYLQVIRSIEGLPRLKRRIIELPDVISTNEEFIRLLEISYPIRINGNEIQNLVNEIPVIERIYDRLNASKKPIDFDALWLSEGISVENQSGLRIKVARDPRFVIYGKLGIVGLTSWDYLVDQVISSSIPNATFSLIKSYCLTGVSFSTISKLYSRIDKSFSLNSWRSNLTLFKGHNIVVKGNIAITEVDYSDVFRQATLLEQIESGLNRLVNSKRLGGKELMRLGFLYTLIDYRNFEPKMSGYIERIHSLVRDNTKQIVKAMNSAEDGVDLRFLEVCFGLKFTRGNKGVSLLKALEEMLLDGELSFEEKEVIDKWIEDDLVQKEVVGQYLSQSILEGVLKIDQQLAYIFQHRGLERISEALVYQDLKYLFEDVPNISNWVRRSENFIIRDGFIINSIPDKKVTEFVTNISGIDIQIQLRRSPWDNVTYEFSEKINGPALTVYSNSSTKYHLLIEDAIISYLILEGIIDPTNITKARRRISLKLMRYKDQFLV